MKAKIIIWGWVASFILLFAGIGTVESYEFGSQEEALGWMLCMPWVVFSLLLGSTTSWMKIEREKEGIPDSSVR